MRPALRLLRHPVVPGPAAVAPRRRRPGRGGRARRRRPRGGPRGPGPGLVGARPQRARSRGAPGGDAAAHRGPGAPAGAAGRARAGCSTSTPRRSTTRSSTPWCPPACPTSTCRCSTCRDPLVQRMRRWGDGERFLERIGTIRAAAPDAALRSSFILGYPGRDRGRPRPPAVVPGRGPPRLGGLLHLLRGARHLRRRASPARCRPSSPWSGCASARSSRTPSPPSAAPTLVGERLEVLVDEPGVARSHREAPEIDGVVHVDRTLGVGEFHKVMVTGAAGPDLWAES